MHTKIIYLAGFMTSGKSTIGPILSNVIGWLFLDLDSVIEQQSGMTINEMFEQKGEEYFRKVETETLVEVSKLKHIIVSLGGGTLASADNYNIISKSGKIVYLKAKPETIYRRIKNKIDRPLFRDLVLAEAEEKDFLKRIVDLLNQRELFYNKADLIINTDNIDIGKTVDLIANKISKWIYE